jgi:glycerate-2-kinase
MEDVKSLRRKDSKRDGTKPRTAAARLLEEIAREAIAACDPARAVRRAVRPGEARLTICGRTIPLQRQGRLLVIAYGKAAPGMLSGLTRRLEEAGSRRPAVALSIAPRRMGPDPEAPAKYRRRAKSPIRLTRIAGEHPVPERASFTAGDRALRLAGGARAGDDVVFLASGGGSALMAAPLAPFMTQADKTLLHRLLLTSGAPIGTMNTVRKHLSAVKGGRLAVAARRARTQTTLVVCDVDPERYEEVASGPSLPDRSTLDDLVHAIDRFGLGPALPPRVLDGLRAGRVPESPKPREALFRKSRVEMILSNRDLRNAAVSAGLSRGVSSEAVLNEIAGGIEVAVEMVARAIEGAPPGTRLLVLGGEVLTAPQAPGEGGRAQEFALRLALRMSGLGSRPWAFLALGSDGVDGRSPAAGAFVDGTTLDRARAARLDVARFLRESNSHRFFRKLGDDLVTGPTGTNVRDLYLLMTGEAPLRTERRIPPGTLLSGAAWEESGDPD